MSFLFLDNPNSILKSFNYVGNIKLICSKDSNFTNFLNCKREFKNEIENKLKIWINTEMTGLSTSHGGAIYEIYDKIKYTCIVIYNKRNLKTHDLVEIDYLCIEKKNDENYFLETISGTFSYKSSDLKNEETLEMYIKNCIGKGKVHSNSNL